jgi:hypothetical protein
MPTGRIFAATVTISGLVLAACATDPTTAPLTGPSAGPSRAVSTPVDLPTKTCPNTGTDGWTKIDAGAGSGSGAWGSISYAKGKTIAINLNPGYVLEVCVKSGSQVNEGEAAVYTVTYESTTQYITIEQAISHTGWRVITKPPTTELQNLSVSKSANGAYDKKYEWTLTKDINGKASESFVGKPGSTFDVDWNVAAGLTVTEGPNSVAGEITITNPNAIPVNFTVVDVMDDGSAVDVTCPSLTVAGNGMITCTYNAAPATRTATLNTATVSVAAPPVGYTPPVGAIGTINGGIATAAVSFAANVIGDEQTTLADPLFKYSELISASTTKLFEETPVCPSDILAYDVTGKYSKTVTNTATLTGPNTDITKSATYDLLCAFTWKGETATGRGNPWSAVKGAPSTWFMFTPAGANTTTTVDLVAGQHYVAGSVAITRNGTASITITLASGFRFAPVSNNVKILPMASCEPKSYTQPGAYTVKRPAAVGASSITVSGLSSTPCYAIHVDVERAVW